MSDTAERTYSGVQDKADWGDGPWQDEPDKIQWIDEATGLDCLIHRGPLGNLCGYVGVPPTHPLHGSGYEAVDVDVHGGLTYADACQETDSEAEGICHVPEPGRPAEVWWFGFDCGHSGDICPGMEARGLAAGMPPIRMGYETYKSVNYVRAQCRDLAQQLAALARNGAEMESR